MERSKKLPKPPDAILTSDWHLREDVPVCRTDDYQLNQWAKVDFVADLQKKYNCPVIHAGDLFDFWKPSPFLLSETIKHLPKQFSTIYGNHDLPQHNYELAYKCGAYTLWNAKALSICDGISWGQAPENPCVEIKGRRILVWHVFTYQGKEPWPGCDSPTGHKLLKAHPNYDLILTGDNHTPFVEESKGRLLVNPGSLMRMTADQVDFKPRVYFWYADTNTVEPIYIPIEKGAINRDHLDIKTERNNRIDAFVSQLNGDWVASMSFEDNLKIFEKENSVRKSVMDIVYKSYNS